MLVPGDTLSINIDCDDFQVAYQHYKQAHRFGRFSWIDPFSLPAGVHKLGRQ